MTLLDRHLEFVEALRDAGLPVSLAEGLDAVEALTRIGLGERSMLREAYAATTVKRSSHRPAFDQVFDLYFPPLVGAPAAPGHDPRAGSGTGTGTDPEPSPVSVDDPRALADFRERLAELLAIGDVDALTVAAREGVQRFGLIRGRQPGEQRWSAYNVGNRVRPGELVERVLAGLLGELDTDAGDEPPEVAELRRAVLQQVGRFEELVETEVRRRASEVRGPAHIAKHTVRPSIERVDFSSARKADLEEMRRAIQPLARRLATRLSREQRARARGPLDFRRTVRASVSTGGVPLETFHRPRHPGRTDLVVLCDVSGSVANFANFTLMLVYALREQFQRVRAFTFVDEIHEVTEHFTTSADPAETLAALAASAEYASLWGRTNYGRAFSRFETEHLDALDPRTNLLVLGDARSNHTDLALPVVRRLVHEARHSWWLNPESTRHWDTGDSAARDYGSVVPMRECRNLTQLEAFVHDLA